VILDQLLKLNINEVWTSVYPRAIQTVMPYLIEKGKKFNTDDCLHEHVSFFHFIPPYLEKYHPADEVDIRYGPHHDECHFRENGIKIPEPHFQVRNRIIEFIKKHGQRLDNSLIVSHGSVLSEFHRLLNGYPKNVKMGEIYEIILDLDRFNLLY
jgi:broad specificity phosphatase PhoE